MILSDGRIFARNLTPGLARLLASLNPADETMQQRLRAADPACPP